MPSGWTKPQIGVFRGTGRGEDKSLNETTAHGETARFIKAAVKSERKWIRNRPPIDRSLGDIAVRPMTVDDASYVIDSWANSYRRSPVTGPIEREVFNIEQRARIDRIVRRTSTRVFIACEVENREKIRGWICFEPPVDAQGTAIVHYVCVQPYYQLNGVGTALVNLARSTMSDADAPIWATHETAPMRHVRARWNMLFNPYLLELPAAQSQARNAPPNANPEMI